jgi:predicted Holliday junction resolvase-like endonuclease
MGKNILFLLMICIALYLYIDADSKVKLLEKRIQHASDSIQDNFVDSTLLNRVLELQLEKDSVATLLNDRDARLADLFKIYDKNEKKINSADADYIEQLYDKLLTAKSQGN